MHRCLAVPMPIFRSRDTLSERFRQVVAFPPELLEYSSWETRSGRGLFRRTVTSTAFRSQPLGQPEIAIGQEPQIEPWLAPDNHFACRFQNGLASSQPHDENRWGRKPKQPGTAVQRTESMGRKVRTILAHSQGLESKKISGRRRGVFLDFSFYRTSWDLASLGCCLDTSQFVLNRRKLLFEFALFTLDCCQNIHESSAGEFIPELPQYARCIAGKVH